MNPMELAKRRALEQQQAGGIPTEIKSVPDRELEACLIEHGQPAHAARELRTNPQARLLALRFFDDVLLARAGHKESRQRVDFLRELWAKMRKEELIADNPARQYTELIDPRRLL